VCVSAVVCPHVVEVCIHIRSWLDHGKISHEKDWSHSNLYLMHMLIMCANTLNYIYNPFPIWELYNYYIIVCVLQHVNYFLINCF
jgi:hypothetical protein